MPPPSSGGIIAIRALKLFDLVGINKTPLLSIDEYHLMAEVLQRAFRDRTEIGDPDHFSVPMQSLLDETRLKKMAQSVKLARATTSEQLKAVDPMPATTESTEKPQTTHISLLDRDGHALAMTFTLNGDYGSGVASEKYGIFLNNEMDDFTTHPGQPNMFHLTQGPGNQVEAGKRPLSSMTPTLVEKDGKVIMAVGAPGGPRIVSAVIQVLYRALGRNQSLERAVESPRVHHQFMPDKVFIDDDDRMPYEIVQGLKARHHDVQPTWWIGRVFAVRNNNGVLEGVVDTRAEGAATGF
jgi:gamma-glutamyltranspeptidase/glutathione hydrolase